MKPLVRPANAERMEMFNTLDLGTEIYMKVQDKDELAINVAEEKRSGAQRMHLMEKLQKADWALLDGIEASASKPIRDCLQNARVQLHDAMKHLVHA